MSLPIIGLIVFAIVVSGAMAGLAASERLPPKHATSETKSVVSVSMAIVGTVSALVLGLLVSTANSSFQTRAGEVTQLSADIVRLDRMLRRYGTEADPARETLRHYAERKTTDLFPALARQVRIDDRTTNELLDRVEDQLLALHPTSPQQQWLMGQALQLAADISGTRWLLTQQAGQGTPVPFLVLVVFWLTLLFASFGLFAPRNLTAGISLVLCALAVSGGVEMILELEQPFTGLVQISPLPMQQALATLNW